MAARFEIAGHLASQIVKKTDYKGRVAVEIILREKTGTDATDAIGIPGAFSNERPTLQKAPPFVPTTTDDSASTASALASQINDLQTGLAKAQDDAQKYKKQAKDSRDQVLALQPTSTQTPGAEVRRLRRRVADYQGTIECHRDSSVTQPI